MSCQEWEPVFTVKYDDPVKDKPVTMQANTTIAELKALYVNKPVKIEDDLIIKGQVTTSDQQGNLYKSFYIQDETGGIEIKMGKNGLYNEYKIGQWVYIDCNGLTLGNYRGMKNLGYEDPTGEYETGYLEIQLFIDTHVFRGEMGEPVKPVVLTEAQVKDPANHGKLVTLNGIKYDNAIFVLAYVDPNGDRKDYTNNGIFIDEEAGHNFGVTTWAMSENKWTEYLYNGNFDSVEVAGKTVGDFKTVDASGKTKYAIGSMAYATSQYFKMGGTSIQVRTSGYAKFADYQMDERILDGTPINLTGILSIYDGNIQFTLIDLSGVEIQ